MTKTNLLIVHQGALGDFLLAWPSILLLRKEFSHTNIFFHGSPERMPFLSPLNIKPAGIELQAAAMSLYGSSSWPPGLENTVVVWFGLQKSPTQTSFHQLMFLPGISQHAPYTSVRQAYLDGLAENKIEMPRDWHTVWPREFRSLPCLSFIKKKYDLLIFPGAGHVCKQWSLVQFFELARLMQSKSLKFSFVLGPVETERGLTVTDFPVHTLQNLSELLALLGSARAVLGNDSGPMHLAGMMGLPGVGLFGPTSARQWDPWGISAVSNGDMSCRPCTQTTADISCQRPECLGKLNLERVWNALAQVLENKTGSLEPLQEAGFGKSRKVI